ncbi:putative Protein kinase domain containing protein [Blattamonas nauphoetae]|uniref:Protein kinase domain-containing protein n=1 Tax=Blattamonas nauphoetae TaxID=2049346 RepID=A0ABQ9X2M8_9EUKA|nr:putative Protein kinase domain containing protein [Blattamonas nauphoetae]
MLFVVCFVSVCVFVFQRVYRVMRDVLDGIAFLHSRGEIYGDLKGSNVLIGKDGIAKLGDFGGVVGTGTMKTSNSAECGTMQFWAPEFFKLAGKTGKTGSSIGSFAGDMWAFGQLLLEMLTSRSWIVGENVIEIQQSVLGFEIGQVCGSVGIVGDLQILLSLLLSKNPSQRISSTELVRTNRLQSVLGSETPLSRFVTQELDTTRQQFQNAFQATKQQYDARINEQKAMISEQVSLLEATRQQLKKEQRERAKEQQEHAKEHEALIREQNERKKTQQLLHKQKQAHQADKHKIQTLENKLSAALEENRRLKDTAVTPRDVSRSLHPSPSAVSSPSKPNVHAIVPFRFDCIDHPKKEDLRSLDQSELNLLWSTAEFLHTISKIPNSIDTKKLMTLSPPRGIVVSSTPDHMIDSQIIDDYISVLSSLLIIRLEQNPPDMALVFPEVIFRQKNSAELMAIVDCLSNYRNLSLTASPSEHRNFYSSILVCIVQSLRLIIHQVLDTSVVTEFWRTLAFFTTTHFDLRLQTDFLSIITDLLPSLSINHPQLVLSIVETIERHFSESWTVTTKQRTIPSSLTNHPFLSQEMIKTVSEI